MASAPPFLFLLTGDEFLRRKKVESLIQQFIPAANRSTNLFRYYPDELNWPAVFTQARTVSLLGGAQLFWLPEANRIKTGDWPLFETYCSEPAPESYFVFEAEEIPGTHPLLSLAKRFGSHQHFDQKQKGGFDLLREKLKRAEKTLTPGAWNALQGRLGDSLSLMDRCLDQLILYASGDTITEEMVSQVSSEFLRYDVFDLTDALIRKDQSASLAIFHFFYELTGDVASSVGLLHWQLRRIWQAKDMLKRGASQSEMAKALRIPPFRLDSFLKQIERFDFAAIEKLIESLWRLDWESKTGAVDEQIAMETLLAGAG